MNNPSIPVADNGGAPAPVPQVRRPRVRQVSSRFLSPSPSPSSSCAAGDLHSMTMKSPRPSPSNNNNRYSPAPHDNNRSFKPSPSRRLLLPHRTSQESPTFRDDNIPETFRSMDYTTQKQQPRAVVKLFKENDIPKSKSLRSDTPSTCDKIVPSRFRLPQHHRQTTSDAAKLLQSSVSSSNHKFESTLDTRSSSSVSDDEEPSKSLVLLRTSTTSSKFSTPTPLCSRSLNLPISLKPPPVVTSTKTGVDSKKGKTCSQQQDVHSLKMLHNHYLLWRYANAKAQASMHAQTTQMQNQFFSLGADIATMRDTVKRKRVELNELLQIKALSSIVEAQMPYLDQWSNLEEDYTCSLSGATNALSNSLLRLPVSGNVQVNIKEAAEALDSAAKTTDMIVHHMLSLFPKAEEMDTLMSELANIVDIEKALVEECGNLLLNTHNLQVEDCSLRGHLMQLAM